MAPVLNLNNEVVKLRKDVKKVKVLTIRKLTRNISKLKSKKGTEELIQKNQRRAQRLLEEIHAIKKLRPDDVTKSALQKEINFEKVCKKPNSTVETRAIARLATQPLLKQKISAIKDAIKAFKEARKIAAKQEAENEETAEAPQIVTVDKEKQSMQQETMQNKIKEDTILEDETLDSPSCATLHEETDIVIDNHTAEKIFVDQNGQKPASHTLPKVSAETKPIEIIPETPASLTVPNVSAEIKPMEIIPEKPASLTVPKVSAEMRSVEGIPEKPASVLVRKVPPQRKLVAGVPENQALENKTEKNIKLGKKISPVHDSGSDSSDIEDSDKEDKEYFDDSTEERFYKQSSGFEDSDSDSEDDFFIGKVRKIKKKKSSKNPSSDKVEKETLPTETTKPLPGGTENLKGIPVPKSAKLESVFCTSLSHTKQKQSIMKREAKLPPARNKKAVVPQPPKLAKKPPPARTSTVKSQSKPEEVLHPSWEASRKRKEQSQIAVFQGKKIVFDD